MRIWLSDGDRRLQDENGYGRVSTALVRGLTELGHELRFQQFREMDLVLFVCPPGRIKFGRPAPAAAFAMHELDYLPEGKRDWPELLNRLDLLITPTDWNRRMWRAEGVTVPIEVVPLGVDVNTFQPPGGRTCTFLAVHENLGSESSRENWRDTLRAYCQAFRADDDVRLVIKTWKWKPAMWREALAQTLAELDLDEISAPAVEVIDSLLSAQELRDLYRGAWLFVKNANREGWSLPCTEAVACGSTVAATRIEPLLSHLGQDTRWFEAGDVDGLARLLGAEHARFTDRLAYCQRYSAKSMARQVESLITRMLDDALDGDPDVDASAVRPSPVA